MIKTFIVVNIIVLTILAIRKVCGYRLSKKVQYALWLFVPVCLIFTPISKIKLNINNDVIEKSVVVSELKSRLELSGNSINKKYHVSHVNLNNYLVQQPKDRSGTDIYKYVIILYFFIAIVLFFLFASLNFMFWRKCLKTRMLVKKDKYTGLRVYQISGKQSPFLLGNNIYLPSCIDDIDAIEYQCIVYHEYCHWLHRDILWKFIKHFILIIYWFDPLFWYASYCFDCDCEMACDEEVLNIMGNQCTEKYGQLLIKLGGGHKNSMKWTVVTMNNGFKELKERVVNMMNKKRKKWVEVCSVILLLILCGVSFVNVDFSMTSAAVNESAEKLEKNKLEKEQLKEDKISVQYDDVQEENCYYNSVKTDGQNYYYVNNELLVKYNIRTKKKEIISKGIYKLGDLVNNKLYYTKIDENKFSIGFFELDNMNNTVLYSCEDSGAGGVSSPIVDKQQFVYFEKNYEEEKYIYKIDQDRLVVENIEIKQNDIDGDIMPDYAYSYVKAGLIVVLNSKQKLCLYSSEGDFIDQIDNYLCNLVIDDKKLIYTDTDKNICIYNVENQNISILYGCNNGMFNYGTLDLKGVYGMMEYENGSNYIAMISWDGTLQLMTEDIEGENISSLSALNDNIVFLNKNKMKIISN